MPTFVSCESPGCANVVTEDNDRHPYFCDQCREDHSYHTLLVQVEHDSPIRDLILEAAAMFGSAARMADYFDVCFVTVYSWLEKYFNMRFQEFRRAYICKSDRCYTLDIRRSSYSRNDYVLKKLKSRRYCACVNALDSNMITTNAPLSEIQDVFRGSPRIEQITDNCYALVTNPVEMKAELGLDPVYSRVMPIYSSDF